MQFRVKYKTECLKIYIQDVNSNLSTINSWFRHLLTYIILVNKSMQIKKNMSYQDQKNTLEKPPNIYQVVVYHLHERSSLAFKELCLAYSCLCWELDEKIETVLMSVAKYL